MCKACDFTCCASDEFDQCGCEHCYCEDCRVDVCLVCGTERDDDDVYCEMCQYGTE